jgi:tetratricopeptide (TPR) repeat protein
MSTSRTRHRATTATTPATRISKNARTKSEQRDDQQTQFLHWTSPLALECESRLIVGDDAGILAHTEDTSDSVLKIWRAWALLNLNRNREAMTLLEPLIDADIPAHGLLAAACRELEMPGKTDEALARWRSDAGVHPALEVFYQREVIARWLNGTNPNQDARQAKALAVDVIGKAQGHMLASTLLPSLLQFLSDAMRQIGFDGAALGFTRHALKFNNQRRKTTLLYQKLLSEVNLGAFVKAFESFAALESLTHTEEVHPLSLASYGCGVFLHSVGQSSRAKPHFVSALNADAAPHRFYAHLRLSECATMLDDHQDAQHHLEQANALLWRCSPREEAFYLLAVARVSTAFDQPSSIEDASAALTAFNRLNLHREITQALMTQANALTAQSKDLTLIEDCVREAIGKAREIGYGGVYHLASSKLLERLHESDELTRLLLKPGRNYFNQTHQATELLREKVSADLLQQMRTSSQEEDFERTLELCVGEKWATREAAALGSVAALRLREYKTASDLSRKAEREDLNHSTKPILRPSTKFNHSSDSVQMHLLNVTRLEDQWRINAHVVPPGLDVELTIGSGDVAYYYCGQYQFDFEKQQLRLNVWDSMIGDPLEIVLNSVSARDCLLLERY